MDLFNYTPPAQFDQLELAGPSLHVGRKCKCGAAFVTTESGFDSCSRGCGKLEIPKGYTQEQVQNVSIPIWRKP